MDKFNKILSASDAPHKYKSAAMYHNKHGGKCTVCKEKGCLWYDADFGSFFCSEEHYDEFYSKYRQASFNPEAHQTYI